MKSALLTLALVLATVGVATARDTRLFSVEEIELISHLSPLPPPPADPTNALAEDPAAARLGQYLFFDPRLSGSGTIACASGSPPDSRSSIRRRPVANQSSSAIPAASTGIPTPAATCRASSLSRSRMAESDMLGSSTPTK